MGGYAYQQIVQQLGHTNKGTAHRGIAQARKDESVDEMRRLELDRLDAVHASMWPRAMDGHVPSVLALLRAMDLRTKLLGLQSSGNRKRKPEDTWPSCHGPATVVLHPDDCRHVGCARHGSFANLTPA